MPAKLPKEALEAANAAVVFAQQVRKHHRRRTGRLSDRRNADIDTALQRLKDSMRPLKTEIGKFPYGPQTDAAERNRDKIRAASSAIQRERRKLWKMKTKEQTA